MMALATASVVRVTPSARRAASRRRSAVRRARPRIAASRPAGGPRLPSPTDRVGLGRGLGRRVDGVDQPVSTGPSRRRSSISRSTTVRSASPATTSPTPPIARRAAPRRPQLTVTAPVRTTRPAGPGRRSPEARHHRLSRRLAPGRFGVDHRRGGLEADDGCPIGRPRRARVVTKRSSPETARPARSSLPPAACRGPSRRTATGSRGGPTRRARLVEPRRVARKWRTWTTSSVGPSANVAALPAFAVARRVPPPGGPGRGAVPPAPACTPASPGVAAAPAAHPAPLRRTPGAPARRTGYCQCSSRRSWPRSARVEDPSQVSDLARSGGAPSRPVMMASDGARRPTHRRLRHPRRPCRRRARRADRRRLAADLPDLDLRPGRRRAGRAAATSTRGRQNPTRERLERAVADLEGGTHGIAFASGSAATAAIAQLAAAGEEILVGDDVYGGTFRYLERVHRPAGAAVGALRGPRPGPDALWEGLDARDPPGLARDAVQPAAQGHRHRRLRRGDPARARRAGRRTAAAARRSTTRSPRRRIQRPLELGADVVFHSATKYLGGHSDTVVGVAVTQLRRGGGPAAVPPERDGRRARAVRLLPRAARAADARAADGAPLARTPWRSRGSSRRATTSRRCATRGSIDGAARASAGRGRGTPDAARRRAGVRGHGLVRACGRAGPTGGRRRSGRSPSASRPACSRSPSRWAAWSR